MRTRADSVRNFHIPNYFVKKVTYEIICFTLPKVLTIIVLMYSFTRRSGMRTSTWFSDDRTIVILRDLCSNSTY